MGHNDSLQFLVVDGRKKGKKECMEERREERREEEMEEEFKRESKSVYTYNPRTKGR